jgi:hypothetical protein
MKNRPKEPAIPVHRVETIRQRIVSLLLGHTFSAKELSVEAGISEREVYIHLEHIQKSFSKSEDQFCIIPAQCKKCGFAFRKREKLKKPGKCPVCRGEQIQEPLFSIKRSNEPR